MLLLIATILLLLAACLGIGLLVPILKNKSPLKTVIVLHGLGAILAIIIIIGYAISGHQPFLVMIAILLILAAISGFVVLKTNINKNSIRVLLAILHPLLVGLALIALIAYLVSALVPTPISLNGNILPNNLHFPPRG
jgi:hypothetical protein